jgi:hypothetical protein
MNRTDAEFKEYISTTFLPGANRSTLEPLWSYYPAVPSDGSPFNTSNFNAITRQYKRISAFQGDVVFEAPRRFFLEHLSGKQKLWSYGKKSTIAKELSLTLHSQF